MQDTFGGKVAWSLIQENLFHLCCKAKGYKTTNVPAWQKDDSQMDHQEQNQSIVPPLSFPFNYFSSFLSKKKKNSLLPPAKTNWPLPWNSSLSLFIKLPKQTPPQAVSSLFFRLLFLSLPREWWPAPSFAKVFSSFVGCMLGEATIQNWSWQPRGQQHGCGRFCRFFDADGWRDRKATDCMETWPSWRARGYSFYCWLRSTLKEGGHAVVKELSWQQTWAPFMQVVNMWAPPVCLHA